MKVILNTTRSSSERYTLIDEPMGNYGQPSNSPNHEFSVANGVDGGCGYQGYMSIDYFFSLDYIPKEAKIKCKQVLKDKGYKV